MVRISLIEKLAFEYGLEGEEGMNYVVVRRGKKSISDSRKVHTDSQGKHAKEMKRRLVLTIVE